MNNKRSAYIDIAKAIGIFFVVLGHHFDHGLYAYIYSFHMPLFFFLSGLTFFPVKYSGFGSFALIKIKRLMVPYLILSFFLFLVWAALEYVSGWNSSVVIKHLIGIFYSQGQLDYMSWGVMMWFLPCLFLVNLLGYSLVRFKSLWMRWCLAVVVCSFGFVLFPFLGFNLPWSMDVALVCFPFFLLGYELRNVKIDSVKVVYRLIGLFVFLGINIVFFLLNPVRVDVYLKIFGNILCFFLSAVGGIGFYLILSSFIAKNRVLEFCGRNSLFVLAFHMRAWTFLNQVFVKKIDGLQIEGIAISMIVSLLQVAIVLTGVFVFKVIVLILRKRSVSGVSV